MSISMQFPSSSLRDAALAPATLLRYDRNLQGFLTHARINPQQLLALDAALVDASLADYFEHLHAEGGSYTYACHTLNGLIFRRPGLRLQLGESHLRLRGWARSRTATSHPPLTWELAVLFAAKLSLEGHHGEAVAILLSFDCYLRVGEMTRLRFCDVVAPDDSRMGAAFTGMALRLPTTKTGLNQWVELRDPAVTDLLLLHISRRHPDSVETDRVFPFTPARFRGMIRRAAVAAGVGDTPYVAHSLRHGGATADFLRGSTIDQVMFRGRWKGMESARRYIQTGRALLAAQQVPRELNQLGALLDDHLVQILTHFITTVPLVLPRPVARRVTFADQE